MGGAGGGGGPRGASASVDSGDDLAETSFETSTSTAVKARVAFRKSHGAAAAQRRADAGALAAIFSEATAAARLPTLAAAIGVPPEPPLLGDVGGDGASMGNLSITAVEETPSPSAPWLVKASKSWCGLAKLGIALGVTAPAASTNARMLPSGTGESESTPLLPGLACLAPLFAATAAQRGATGDDETCEAVTTAALIVRSLPAYRDAFDLGRTFQRESALDDEIDTDALDHVSVITQREHASPHTWQPWHYAVANSRAAVCSLLRKSGYGEAPEPAAMDAAGAAAEHRAREQASEEARLKLLSSDTVSFPTVDIKPSAAVAKAAGDAALVALALPPPPPPPGPRWFEGYYDTRKPSGVRFAIGSLGRASAEDAAKRDAATSDATKWNLTGSSTDFTNSVHLGALAWMVRRGLAKEVAARLPLIRHADEPLNPQGATLLMVAAYHGQAELVRALVEAGADVNRFCRVAEPRFPSGITALHLAVMNGQTATAEALLELGADPNAKEENGNTPLHHAVLRRNFALTKVLLRNHAAIHHANHKGDTAEDVATCLRDADVTRLLHWWAISSVVEPAQDHLVEPCHTAQQLRPWIEQAAVYYRRLDMLHRGYIALSNHDPNHSVPCLMYEKICKRLQLSPARSVMAQLLPYWWPEEVRTVDLGGIFLGEPGMVAVYTLTKVLPRLEMVDLTGCKLTNDSVAALCKAVESHPFLRKIVLAHNKDLSHSKRLLELLAANKRIVQLDVVGTAIEVPTQAKILRMAEDNKRGQALCYADHEFVAKRASPQRLRASTPGPGVGSDAPQSNPVEDRNSATTTATKSANHASTAHRAEPTKPHRLAALRSQQQPPPGAAAVAAARKPSQ